MSSSVYYQKRIMNALQMGQNDKLGITSMALKYSKQRQAEISWLEKQSRPTTCPTFSEVVGGTVSAQNLEASDAMSGGESQKASLAH